MISKCKSFSQVLSAPQAAACLNIGSETAHAAPDFREDSGPWAFRGRRIAKATMQMLLDYEGLADATDVLVVGDSTGGVATMQMIDDLYAQVCDG